MKAQVAVLSPSRDSSFSAEFYSAANFSHPFHSHPEVELTYIVSSEGTRIVGDHLGSFEAGDLCLMGAHLPHIYRNSRRTGELAQAEVLQFLPETILPAQQNAPEFLAVKELLRLAGRGLVFPKEVVTKVYPMMCRIRETRGLRRWIHFLEILEILASARSYQVLASSGYSLSLAKLKDDRIQRACQYVLENFEEDLSQKELSEMINVTPTHFSRLFKQATGKSYRRFLSELRLGHACRLLQETSGTVVEVAFSSGFHNLSAFNRQFLSKYGCSPRDYRKRHSACPDL